MDPTCGAAAAHVGVTFFASASDASSLICIVFRVRACVLVLAGCPSGALSRSLPVKPRCVVRLFACHCCFCRRLQLFSVNCSRRLWGLRSFRFAAPAGLLRLCCLSLSLGLLAAAMLLFTVISALFRVAYRMNDAVAHRGRVGMVLATPPPAMCASHCVHRMVCFLIRFVGLTGSVGARCSLSPSFFGCRNRCLRH